MSAPSNDIAAWDSPISRSSCRAISIGTAGKWPCCVDGMENRRESGWTRTIFGTGPTTPSVSCATSTIGSLPSRSRFARTSTASSPGLQTPWIVRSSWTRASSGSASWRCSAARPRRWLINLRVSKMGGLLRSLQIVEGARAAGIGLIVGAQVGETSLLTRAALTVAHAGRDTLVAQEGAFGTFLLSEDVCNPPLMFGAGGAVDMSSHASLDRPGLGIVDPAWLDSHILQILDS